MLKMFYSAWSRFQLVCSLACGSLQLLTLLLRLIATASRRDWYAQTQPPQKQLQPSTNSQLPQHQEPLQLTDEEDAELTQEWLDLLSEPQVIDSCAYHLNRCYDNDSATKRTNT